MLNIKPFRTVCSEAVHQILLNSGLLNSDPVVIRINPFKALGKPNAAPKKVFPEDGKKTQSWIPARGGVGGGEGVDTARRDKCNLLYDKITRKLKLGKFWEILNSIIVHQF
jgi:hypothetical protein